MTVMVFVILVGNGVGWTLYRNVVRSTCEERNQRAVAAGRVFDQAARATALDGDAHQARLWQQYMTAVSATPLPRC